jgi:hypothetical protein
MQPKAKKTRLSAHFVSSPLGIPDSPRGGGVPGAVLFELWPGTAASIEGAAGVARSIASKERLPRSSLNAAESAGSARLRQTRCPPPQAFQEFWKGPPPTTAFSPSQIRLLIFAPRSPRGRASIETALQLTRRFSLFRSDHCSFPHRRPRRRPRTTVGPPAPSPRTNRGAAADHIKSRPMGRQRVYWDKSPLNEWSPMRFDQFAELPLAR